VRRRARPLPKVVGETLAARHATAVLRPQSISRLYAAAENVTVFDESVDLPARRRFALLIINFDKQRGRAVSYNVVP
jgi:hypothetical protein